MEMGDINCEILEVFNYVENEVECVIIRLIIGVYND